MELFDEAEAFVALARVDPEQAIAQARDFIARYGQDEENSAAIAEAWRAVGAALRSERDLEGAHVAFDAGLEVASADLYGPARARLLISRCILWHEVRDLERTMADLDEAERLVAEDFRGVFLFQRGSIIARTDPTQDCMVDLAAAQELLTEYGPEFHLGDLLLNIGLVAFDRGDVELSRSSMEQAHEIFVRLGFRESAGLATHNLGYAYAGWGDFLLAEKLFREAEQLMPRQDRRFPMLRADHGTALLSVGLASEALDVMLEAATAMQEAGLVTEACESYTKVCAAALRCGRYAETVIHAETCAKLAGGEAGLSHYAGLAEHYALRARDALGEAPGVLTPQVERIAKSFADAQWPQQAEQSWMFLGELLARSGRPAEARTIVEQAGAHDGPRPLEVRLHRELVRAEIALAERRPLEAMQACEAGVAAMREFQSTLGAVDVRAHIAGLADRLVEIGTQLALAERNDAGLMSWLNLTTATALATPPVLPSDDVQLRADLAALNEVTIQLRASLPAERRESLVRERDHLQRSISDRSRLAQPAASTVHHDAGLEALRTSLQQRAMVQFIRCGKQLSAIVIRPDAVQTIQDLVDWPLVEALLDEMSTEIETLLAGRVSTTVRMLDIAAAIDEILLEPLQLGDLPLVIVPTPELNVLSWSVLPSLSARAITIAPSASAWVAATQGRAPGKRAICIAGPDLEHAEGEARAVSSALDARYLDAASATKADVLHHLETADTAHMACHATFVEDNALFTSLRLADGDVYVHDLHGLSSSPALVVLSACQSGQHAVPSGSELIGLTASLMAMGTRTLVSANIPLVDSPVTRDTLIHFHELVAGGVGPAHALAESRAKLDPHNPVELLTIAALQCQGAGW